MRKKKFEKKKVFEKKIFQTFEKKKDFEKSKKKTFQTEIINCQLKVCFLFASVRGMRSKDGVGQFTRVLSIGPDRTRLLFIDGISA